MKRQFSQSTLLIAILLLSPLAMLGQGRGQGKGPPEPLLTNAVADVEAATISISGDNFGSSPRVFMGTNFGTLVELGVNIPADTFIEAALASTDPGTYLLVVSSGPGNAHMSAMDVTIGAVGHSLDAADGDPVDALFVNNDGSVSIGGNLDVVGSIRSDGTLVCLADGTDCPPGTPNPHIITEGSPTFNTAIGVDAFVSNTTGSNNTASGASALFSNTTGGLNTAVGRNALFSNTAGSGNTAVGRNALQTNTTGSENTAVGINALFSNTAGQNNIAIGRNALLSNNIGSNNTAVGPSALRDNTAGQLNTAVGRIALSFNTTGSGNTAMGEGALGTNTTGVNNTAVGRNALQNTTGSRNTAMGLNALSGNTTGSNNAAMGRDALISNTTGFENTASGFEALSSNTTGNRNTAIGRAADVSMGNLTNATAIGFGAIVNASNKVRIGNSAVTVIQGEVGFTMSSDRNQKENFKPVDGEEVLEKIREIPVQSWNYIGHDPKEFRHYGPVAQDFFAAFGHDNIGTVGTSTTINSGDMQGILMIAVQVLEKLAAEQREDIKRLKARLEELEKAGYGNNVLSDSNDGLARLERILTARQSLAAQAK